MKLRSMDKLTITPGEYYTVYMPYSEACMHMRVAGKRMWFVLSKSENPSVQLYHRRTPVSQLEPFSFPITTGEAGVYHEGTVEDYRAGRGFYCYPMANIQEEAA